MRLFRFRHRPGPAPRDPRARAVVRLRGALDARNAAMTGRGLVRIIDAGAEVLEVDLAEVTHLSPDGCAALFTALRAARARGTRWVVTHADNRARSILHQIGLSRALSNGDSEVP